MKTNLLKFSTVARFGIVAAAAATLTIACGKPQSSVSAKPGAGKAKTEEKIAEVLKAKLKGQYKPEAPENLELAGRLEGSSAEVTSQYDESGKPTAHNVAVEFVITGEENPLQAAGTLTDMEMHVLAEGLGANKNYRIHAGCTNQACIGVLAVVEYVDPANPKVPHLAPVMFTRKTEKDPNDKTGKKLDVADGSANAGWAAPTKMTTPKDFMESGKKFTSAQAKEARRTGIAPKPDTDKAAADKAAADKAAADKAAADKAAADKAAADKAAADKAAADKAAADKAAADKAAADKAAADKAAADKAAADKAAADKAAADKAAADKAAGNKGSVDKAAADKAAADKAAADKAAADKAAADKAAADKAAADKAAADKAAADKAAADKAAADKAAADKAAADKAAADKAAADKAAADKKKD
jgi:hypothetical protein